MIESDTSVPNVKDNAKKIPDTTSYVFLKTNFFSKMLRLMLIVTLLSFIVAGIVAYWWGYQNFETLQFQINNLQKQFVELKHTSLQDKEELENRINIQNNSLSQIEGYKKEWEVRLKQVEKQSLILQKTDTNKWLLINVHLLIKQADRELKINQDIPSAQMLLKNASAFLEQINDQSVYFIHSAISEDLVNLSKITQINYSDIFLKLNVLINKINNFYSRDTEQHPVEQVGLSNSPVSNTTLQWKDNLISNWKHFLSQFITIRPRHEEVASSLTSIPPNYMKENLRFQLYAAIQAVQIHNNVAYQRAITSALILVKSYFDTSDSSVNSMLNLLQQLSKQPINLNVSVNLKSLPLIENQIKIIS